MTQKDRKIVLKILFQVTEALERNKITYLIFGSTVLGSYRHHRMIPWEEDAGMCFRVKLLYCLAFKVNRYDKRI